MRINAGKVCVNSNFTIHIVELLQSKEPDDALRGMHAIHLCFGCLSKAVMCTCAHTHARTRYMHLLDAKSFILFTEDSSSYSFFPCTLSLISSYSFSPLPPRPIQHLLSFIYSSISASCLSFPFFPYVFPFTALEPPAVWAIGWRLQCSSVYFFFLIIVLLPSLPPSLISRIPLSFLQFVFSQTGENISLLHMMKPALLSMTQNQNFKESR